ncbi:hypothetical protein Tco_0614610, partial [Tanacetum coccineum]
MPDRQILELEDQINFLLKGPQPTPKASSTHTPQAYANAVFSNPLPRGLNEPPRKSSFTFCKRVCPNPQPQALETSFETRVDYMAAHTEWIERFNNIIFKQREEINDRMVEMFGLLKERTTSRTPEKILMRKEVRHPITKNANSISLIRIEEKENKENNKQINNSAMESGKSCEEEPLEGINTKNEAIRRTDDEPAKIAKENVTKNEEDKLAGVFGSHAV